jgi:hypothetical protein
MPTNLTLQLADGSTIEGEIDGQLSARAQDLLNAADHTNLRLSTDEESDVEGHGAGNGSVTLRIADDVEGHAFTLRLPSAEAARDLQTKLLATGALVGVVVIGATVAQTAPNLSIGTTPGAAPAPITRSATDDMGIMDASGAAIVDAAPAVTGGAVHPGQTRVDLRTGDNVAPIIPPNSADPGVRDRDGGPAAIPGAALRPGLTPFADGGLMDASGNAITDRTVDSVAPIIPPNSADPGVRDRDGSPAPVDTETAPTDTPPGGLPRAR